MPFQKFFFSFSLSNDDITGLWVLKIRQIIYIYTANRKMRNKKKKKKKNG